MSRLTSDQLNQFHSHGFLHIPGFATEPTTTAMLAAAKRITEQKAAGEAIADALIIPEAALEQSLPLAQRTSKIFRVHRHEKLFREFASASDTTDIVASLMGDNLDCFLSQFIFKQPGALGQPWHQDAFYFPFEGPPQIGLWLAVTDARMDNGPLWILPGSHHEPVHPAVKDQREHANYAYVEIVDHEMAEAVPVLMQAGDLLVFHSHLMHKSTDNGSRDLRAAMVYHYATADTIDHSVRTYGRKPANQDWLPVLRDGLTPAVSATRQANDFSSKIV
jgi:phytanoyl-CoA hydroxylase